MKINTLIVIPARSGSKGLPDKNIKDLSGKPLLAWTVADIFAAKLANTQVILSTDSKSYASLGQKLGLEVPFLRPAALSADTTSAIDVVLHALDWFASVYHYIPEQLMWLQPTSPFRTAASLIQAVNLLRAQQADAVVACQEIQRNLSALFNTEAGYLTALNKNMPPQSSRQQITPLLTPNGALYLCKTMHLLTNKTFYPVKTLPLVMNKVMSLDIDTEEDWLIAEAYIKQGLIV